jgi:hypothetical protein
MKLMYEVCWIDEIQTRFLGGLRQMKETSVRSMRNEQEMLELRCR